MNKALQVGLTLVGIYIFFQAFIAIADFIGLSADDYINYLLWVVALVLFWLFLPKETGSEFFK